MWKINLENIKSFFFHNKTLEQTVLKNAFWLGLAEFVDRGLGLLVIIWITRHFGPLVYGKFAFALSFTAIFATFSDFGLGVLTIREVARDKSKAPQYIDNILAIKLILGLITFGLIFLTSHFLPKDALTIKLIYFLGIYYIVNTFSTFFRSIFQAHEKMQYETACRAIQGISEFVLVVIFILNNASILATSFTYTIAALIGIAFSLSFVWNYFSKFFYKIDFNVCKEILSEAWSLALNGLAGIIYASAGIILLSIMKGDKAVGWYGAGYSLIPAIVAIPGLLMSALYPRLSAVYKESEESFKKIFLKIIKYIFVLDIILIPLFFVLSRKIILVFYGNAYANSVTIFRILLIMAFLDYFGCIFSNALYAVKKQAVYTKVIFIGLLLNVILSAVLIPNYSYVGLGVAMLVSDFFIVLTPFFYIRKTIFKKVRNDKKN